ncbi:MAG: alpha/beta hydrolase [Propionibacteriaceae bacterium]|nr:alpha/beta hydrolase [Propionibacteriaceae bacterium]
MSGGTTLWQEICDLPHQLTYVQVGPWRTRVLDVGEGNRTIVLMNGTSGHLEAFTPNIRALAGVGRVIAYDYPGHGYTTLATTPLEIPDYEQHLIGLLDALGIDKATLCGESLGGWIAIKFAQHHPQRVASLILAAPGGQMISMQAMSATRSVSDKAAEDPTFDNVKERLQLVIHNKDLITDELVESRRAIYAREGFVQSMKSIMVLQNPEIRYRNRITEEDFAALPVPTLLVWTDHEPSGGVDTGERLAGLIPDGELLAIHDAAHWPQWEDPVAFNAAAVDFLERRS